MTGAVALYGFAVLAGAMDAMVGAGGLIQIPALLIFASEAEVAAILGTHKFASSAGTAAAVYQYHRAGRFTDWALLAPVVVSALVGAFFGARTVSLMPAEYLRPALLGFLIAAALYVFRKTDLDVSHLPSHAIFRRPWFGLALGLALGFYDGAIGLGAGSLFLLAFVGFWKLDFLSATAAARVVNLVTNLSAAAAFAYSESILYAIAVPLALFNVLGAIAGARFATTRGSGFVRVVFLVTVTALIMKVAYGLVFDSSWP